MDIPEIISRLVEAGLGRPLVEFGNQTIFPMSVSHLWPKVDDPRDIHEVLRSAAGKGLPLRIYIHVPFCRTKCRYCAYYSVPGSQELVGKYLSSIEKEMELAASLLSHSPKVYQVYVGGGTPTFLRAEGLVRLFSALRGRFYVGDRCPWTVETTPSFTTPELMSALVSQDVNILCIGIQSFDDKVLEACGRDHTSKEAANAVQIALNAGFSMVNVDLIYGLPKQTRKSFAETVRRGIDLGIPEFSLYLLRANPSTQVKKQEDYFRTEVEMFADAAELFERSGYVRVRPHHWVRDDALAAWQELRSYSTPEEGLNIKGGTTLSFGPGAKTHIGDNLYINTASIKEYCQMLDAGTLPVTRGYTLTKRDRIARFYIGQLGQLGRLDREEYSSRFGEVLPEDAAVIDLFVHLGLVEEQGRFLATTRTGKLFFDCIERAFYPPEWKKRIGWPPGPAIAQTDKRENSKSKIGRADL